MRKGAKERYMGGEWDVGMFSMDVYIPTANVSISPFSPVSPV